MSSPPVMPPAIPTRTMRCPRCGAALAPEGKSKTECSACGAFVDVGRCGPMVIGEKCRVCGQTLGLGAYVCPQCGQPRRLSANYWTPWATLGIWVIAFLLFLVLVL